MFYEKRNLDNISKLADHTKAAALAWHNFLVQNNIEVLIYETIRTVEQQRVYVKQGASKTMKSYHLVGQALDFVPSNDKGETLWNEYGRADIQKAIAEAKRLGFEWGGDWKSFVDKPHLQFNYKGYGTDTFNAPAPAPVVNPVKNPDPVPKKISPIEKYQVWLNERYGAGLTVDGKFGPATLKASIKAYQKEVGVTADGIWGPKSKAAAENIRLNARGPLVWIAQGRLTSLGYDTEGVDGIFGTNTSNAAIRFQKAKGLGQDGIIGKNSWEALLRG